MNEKEAVQKQPDSYHEGYADGYLEAIEKAKVLEDTLRTISSDRHKVMNGEKVWSVNAHPTPTMSADMAIEALAQWEKEK